MNLIEFIETHKNIYVFGIGKNGKKLSQVIHELGYKIDGYIDNNPALKNCTYKNITIYSPFNVNGGVVISVLQDADNIQNQLVALGIKNCNIYIPSVNELIPPSYITEDETYMYHHPVDGSNNAIIENQIKQKKYNEIIMSIPSYPYVAKKYHVSICAIFKNEAPYLKEWIEFHRIIGIDHFYLYNNMSDDNYYDIIHLYVSAGIVTLIDWPFSQAQIAAYRDCIDKYSYQSDWIGFIDLDEFVVPIASNNISSFLDSKSNYPSVLIHWKIFGSAQLIQRDLSEPVTESFTCCWPKLSDVGKCFFNTNFKISNSKQNSELHHILWVKIGKNVVPPIDCNNTFCEANAKLEGNPKQEIQINHYVTKSLNEYHKKMLGTDVYFEKNPHTREMFEFHDCKCTAFDNSIHKYINELKLKLNSTNNSTF